MTSVTSGKPSAEATASRYAALTATTRARESARISAMPSARSMVEIGTGTAPIRMAARYTTTNSGRVRHDHDHALLGLEAEAAQAAGGVRDTLGEFGVADVAGHAGQREPVPASLPDVPVEQVVTGVEERSRCHGAVPTRGGRSRSRTAGR